VTRISNALGALAAAGLLLAQPAAAAVRSGSPVGDSEKIEPGSGMVVGLILLLAVVFGIMAITDDDGSNSPSSP
jgi:hypothetical protein